MRVLTVLLLLVLASWTPVAPHTWPVNQKPTQAKLPRAQSPAKVLTLVEKNLVQHFLKHLVGVDESSCKSSVVHHGFSTDAHARRRPAHNQTDTQVQQKYLLEIFPSNLCACWNCRCSGCAAAACQVCWRTLNWMEKKSAKLLTCSRLPAAVDAALVCTLPLTSNATAVT